MSTTALECPPVVSLLLRCHSAGASVPTLQISTRWRRALAAGCMLLTLAAAGDLHAQTADTPQAFLAAMQDYENNHWPQAYAPMARLADDGNAEAARIALQMWLHGRRLYGIEFEASVAQVQLWSRRSVCGPAAEPGRCVTAAMQR